MGTIRYTKTHFNESERINEESYLNLKSLLLQNPDFEIDSNPETFTQHFSGRLKTIGIAIVVFFFSFGLFEDGSPMIAVGGIAMVVLFYSVLNLFLEGPSFATYVKQKKEYYERMKYAIRSSNSYMEFVTMFYN